jgi:hypothetical protein
MAILTFDTDYSKDFEPINSSNERDESNSNALLWEIHRLLLENLKNQNHDMFNMEEYDQFGIYFELMRVIPKGSELVNEIFGRSPRLTGPIATIPSRTHAATVDAMINMLKSISPKYNTFHEFSGLQGVFPIDTAVYYGDQLIALIEIDGKYHYKQSRTELLRRSDKMKKFLYEKHYPDVPFYRERLDQTNASDKKSVGEDLALRISNQENHARE